MLLGTVLWEKRGGWGGVNQNESHYYMRLRAGQYASIEQALCKAIDGSSDSCKSLRERRKGCGTRSGEPVLCED